MFKGSIVALITPFKNDRLDEENYSRLIHHHISSGTNGIVPAGTTGESPTLSHDEHRKVIEIAVNECRGKIPVIAGTGSNSTAEAIELSKHAEKSGANGLLIVTPYYNKPTQEGMYSHFKKIAEKTKLPIIIYNIPGRSVVDMNIYTMVELSKITNIIGVKDATNDLFRPLLTKTHMRNDFCFLSGEDGTALAFLAQGGHGCISVTANVAPKLCSKMHFAWRNKDIIQAQNLNLKLAKLHNALFIESSPGPVKYAAHLLGLCAPEVRLPLVEIKNETKKKVSEALKVAKLL